jgi:putative tricarboxylic transport membrane protein
MTVPMTETAPRGAPATGDVVLGVLSLAAGIAVFLYASGMPTIAEGLPGPGLFPMIIGAFLAVLGAVLALKALLRRRAPGPAGLTDIGEPVPADSAAGIEAADSGPGTGAGDGVPWQNGIAFYVAAADVLGFAITMFVVLAAIMLVLRSRVLVAVLTAAGITAALYLVFELVLMVQLPNGFAG